MEIECYQEEKMIPDARSENARDNFDKFINQFQPKTKTHVRKHERILKNVSFLFNRTCMEQR